MAPTVSTVAKRARTYGSAAVLFGLLAALAKRSYRNAKMLWLVKRFLGSVLGRVVRIPVPRVVSGAGSTSKVAAVLSELGCKKPLVVTDENLVKFGLVKPCTDALAAAGLQYEIFDKVVPNPPSELVEQGYEIYKNGCDSIIAIGGGSPMDTAKVIGAKVANPKNVEAYAGYFNVNMFGLRPLPPFIAVPTTAGTGSETTVAAMISITSENKKIMIADFGLVPRVAVLDPSILEKLPKTVTAATGMDALTHAIESFLSGWSTSFTRGKSLGATGKILQQMLTTYQNGGDFVARENMLNASFDAGLAFTRANVGYVHAIAHQFGGMFHTPHGDANAMLLPHVLDLYIEDEGLNGAGMHCTNLYCQLAQAGGLSDTIPSDADAKSSLARRLVAKIRQLNTDMAIPTEVKEMKAEHVREVAQRALREAHGELHGFSKPIAHLLDLGMPVPKYITLARCEAIIAEVLPLEQKRIWQGKA